jgi:integral membrane protein
VITAPVPTVRKALTRYRVMAWIVGVMLLLLVTAMVLKYEFGVIESTGPVAIGHGWLYMIYVLLALDLTFRMRWSIPRIFFVVIAGTIPFLSFVAEHKVGWVRRRSRQSRQAAGRAAGARAVCSGARGVENASTSGARPAVDEVICGWNSVPVERVAASSTPRLPRRGRRPT